MARSSYRKFLKQERAKVKLKNREKKLLPKGQNVTDLNFRVKKIVIKAQLKEHAQDEPLSTRKLNIQEILSRLNHYSGSVSTEAVSQLEELLKAGGHSFLSSNLSSVISNLSKLLTSSHSHLRKASIKLLATVLSQVEENEWSVLRGRVVSYIVCGLSHVEPGIRNDSLLALEVVPAVLSLPADVLLPPLLDMVSTSKPTGSRSLSTPLSASPTAHRAAVLQRIATVLSAFPRHSLPEDNFTKGCEQLSGDDVKYKLQDMVRIPLSTSDWSNLTSQILSLSEFSTSTLSSTPHFDIKEFATSLVPLMLDSFSEIAPKPEEHEPVCRLNKEGLQLLSTVADILLQLHHLTTPSTSNQSCWMRDKFGGQIYKRLVEGRFPYCEEAGGKKQRGTKTSSSHPTLKLNLTLALLAQMLVPNSSSALVSHFLLGVLRGVSLSVEESALFERCLSACVSQLSSKEASQLLTSLTRIKRGRSVYKEVFSVLKEVLLSNTTLGSELSTWLQTLLLEIADPTTPLPLDILQLLTTAAPLLLLPQFFHDNYLHILRKAVQRNVEEELWAVGDLLYWVEKWDEALLDEVQQLTDGSSSRHGLATHVVNLLRHKCDRYPEAELCKWVRSHNYWNRIIPVTH